MVFVTTSMEETQEIAYAFAKTLIPGDVVAFYGDLGAGKTAFIRGVARYFGIKEHVTSPTFVIVNVYEGAMPFYHFDMYRIENEGQLYDIGYFEYIDGDGVCMIEWSENIESSLPVCHYKVKMTRNTDQAESGDEPSRTITIEKVGDV